MTFFNRKEEVLDLQLTQYGKYLVSKGKFKPAFYAFSDDEVLYDVAYVSGSKELAASAHERIQNDTVRFKTIYENNGIETRVAELNKHILEKKGGNDSRKRANLNRSPIDDVYGSDYGDHISMAPDDRKLIRNLIGTSMLGVQEVPSWNIKSRNDETFILPVTLSSSAGYGLSRPQLSMSVDHKITAMKENAEVRQYDYTYQNGTEQEIVFVDNVKLVMQESGILLSIAEDNVEFEKENFDIEVFVVEDELVEETTGPSRRKQTVTKLYLAKGNEWDLSDNIDTYLQITFDENIPDSVYKEDDTGVSIYDFGPNDDDACEDSLYEGFSRAEAGQVISAGDTSSTLAGGPGNGGNNMGGGNNTGGGGGY